MPFYDYRCNKCGKIFEVNHGMNGRPQELKCEFCGSFDLQRVFYPVSSIGEKNKEFSGSSDFSSKSSCASCSASSCSTCH